MQVPSSLTWPDAAKVRDKAWCSKTLATNDISRRPASLFLPATPEFEAKVEGWEETGGRREAGSAGFTSDQRRAPVGQSFGSLSRGQQGSSFSGSS